MKTISHRQTDLAVRIRLQGLESDIRDTRKTPHLALLAGYCPTGKSPKTCPPLIAKNIALSPSGKSKL
jgi:hypothetical protein